MRSGAPRSCEGPRRFSFYGGAATWTGCPRLALGAREDAWIRWWDRTDGKLTATELLRVPLLLVDAFDALDELRAEAAAHERSVNGKG
jgi:hypothetical protein